MKKLIKEKNMKKRKRIRMKKAIKKTFTAIPFVLETVHTVLSIIQLLNPQI